MNNITSKAVCPDQAPPIATLLIGRRPWQRQEVWHLEDHFPDLNVLADRQHPTQIVISGDHDKASIRCLTRNDFDTILVYSKDDGRLPFPISL